MLIILEGPDGSGKTHLAERLMSRIAAAQPGAPEPEYIHKRRPDAPTFLAEYLQPIADYLPRSGRTLVLDRWHIGELVYPEMTNRKTLATHIEFAYLEMFLRSRGALVIHVDTPVPQLLQSIDERPDREPLEERVLEQHSEFSRAIRSTKLRSVTYNRVEDTDSMTAIDMLIAHAGAAELDTPRLDLNPTYVGPSRPSVVLIGDRRNVRKNSFEYPTAFVPESATSGRFILEALPKQWTRYGMFGMLNANEGHRVDIFGGEDVPVRFVVLGREAEKTVRDNGELDLFGIVPHPQYVRRFHHHARDRYGMEIQRVATSGEDKSGWRP